MALFWWKCVRLVVCVRESLLLIQACRNLVSDNRSPRPKMTVSSWLLCKCVCVCIASLPSLLSVLITQQYILLKPQQHDVKYDGDKTQLKVSEQTLYQRNLCERHCVLTISHFYSFNPVYVSLNRTDQLTLMCLIHVIK